MPFGRSAIVPRGPAALEAAVQDAAYSRRAAAQIVVHRRLRSSGAQVVPSLVPMLKSGSVPSNRKGIRDRIEWQS